MMKAHLLTIGTEITSGEVVNSNAAWVSSRLEADGVRVFSHLSVRDQRDEMLRGLEFLSDSDLLIVTGGLGPTSDDITREVVAEWSRRALEFDDQVWTNLCHSYQKRGLIVREAHRHQCYFPKESERLSNPVGTAYGFALKRGRQQVFVLPGPPRELEGMWVQEVVPRLLLERESRQWVRWTCLGVPESEVAELVEPLIKGAGIEVGYRAQIPYVKIKIFVERERERELVNKINEVLDPFVVVHGDIDLAEELLELWPTPVLEVGDSVSGALLTQRLFEGQRVRRSQRPELRVSLGVCTSTTEEGIHLSARDDELTVKVTAPGISVREAMTLPYQTKLSSERGRRSAAEWSIWLAVKALRAKQTQSST